MNQQISYDYVRDAMPPCLPQSVDANGKKQVLALLADAIEAIRLLSDKATSLSSTLGDAAQNGSDVDEAIAAVWWLDDNYGADLKQLHTSISDAPTFAEAFDNTLEDLRDENV